eukprot:GGOE01019623.1.p1 GENE.GGOE01019623.1~~GGOE01019623.1.p1  ORF type:complete len:783 (-),score=143.18 GGOE01019623.1:115-2205(-)
MDEKGCCQSHEVQVIVSRCIDVELHPPDEAQLRVLFALATEGFDPAVESEAQAQLRRLTDKQPEPLAQLHSFTLAALGKVLESADGEGPKRAIRAMKCLACLSTLHLAPGSLIQMVLAMHRREALPSPGLRAMATHLLLTCNGDELEWQQFLPPDIEGLEVRELRSVMAALPRHPDQNYAVKLLIHFGTQHPDSRVQEEARDLISVVQDQSLVAQLLLDVLQAHQPQTATDVIMASDQGGALTPDEVLQNALDAWPRPHIAGTASTEALDVVLQLALHAPLEATSSAAQDVLHFCPGVTHVYRQLATHLSLVHSNSTLLRRAIQSFPDLAFADDEVLDRVWLVAQRHHSTAVCDAARALLRTCAGNLHVYRLITKLLEQDVDDRVGAVSSDDLLCALNSCPPLTAADERTFHAVLLMVQSQHPAVRHAARRHFVVDDADDSSIVANICCQLTRVLRCLDDLRLRPRSHIFGHHADGAGDPEVLAFHPAAPLDTSPQDRYRQRMHQVGGDPAQFLVHLLGCYPTIPADPMLDDTVALLVDLAVLAKDEDVRRESARLLRESVAPQPLLCRALADLFHPLPQDYALADILRALPDLSLSERHIIDLVGSWYNHPHCLVRFECHSLLHRSNNAPLVYEWFDQVIMPDTPDADLLLLVAALPPIQRASLSLRDKLVCLTEERRDPMVLHSLTTCLAPILC